MEEARIGELLVAAGVLSDGQVHRILDLQRVSGQPFGLLCEQHLGIEGRTIEKAWATQYARITRTIDPATESYDTQATGLVTRRQAWQFRVLPIRFDGPDLMIATTQDSLCRALRFVTNVIGAPAYLVLADPLRLGEALCRHYSLPGMTPGAVSEGGPIRLRRAAGGSPT